MKVTWRYVGVLGWIVGDLTSKLKQQIACGIACMWLCVVQKRNDSLFHVSCSRLPSSDMQCLKIPLSIPLACDVTTSILEDSGHNFFDRDCLLEFGPHRWTTISPMHGLLFSFCCGTQHPIFIPSDNIVEKLITFLCIPLEECQCQTFRFVFIYQLLWQPSCTHFPKPSHRETISCSSERDIRGNWPESSEIVKCRFCKIACRTLSISFGVTRDGRPLRSSSCTLVQPSVNCLHHRLTILSLIMSGPYTLHNWRWISAGDCFWAFINRITARISKLAGENISAAIFS